jgi:hypothetical protein
MDVMGAETRDGACQSHGSGYGAERSCASYDARQAVGTFECRAPSGSDTLVCGQDAALVHFHPTSAPVAV